jgi:hypothetical protein
VPTISCKEPNREIIDDIIKTEVPQSLYLESKVNMTAKRIVIKHIISCNEILLFFPLSIKERITETTRKI